MLVILQCNNYLEIKHTLRSQHLVMQLMNQLPSVQCHKIMVLLFVQVKITSTVNPLILQCNN